MRNTNRLKLITPVLLAVMVLLFGIIRTSAQEPTPSTSDATSTSKPSADEIARTLARSLDKVEVLQKANEAKDSVIAAQDDALKESEKATDLYKQSSDLNKLAAEKFKTGMETATEMAKREQTENARLTKALKSSHTKTKFAVLTGIAAAVTLFLLK